MSYCKNCQKFEEKEHDTPYGVWAGTCNKLKVGRNPDTWACDKIVVKEEAPDEDAQ